MTTNGSFQEVLGKLTGRIFNGRSRSMNGSRVSQSGLTLIEVMVALLVLSIGLAGVAILHLSSMRYAHSSYYSSIASTAALDLEERLWIVAAENEDSCVTSGQVDDVITALLNRWSGTDANRVVIPNLQINDVDVNVVTGQYTDVSVILRWADNRFGEDLTEEFSYNARVACYFPPDDD